MGFLAAGAVLAIIFVGERGTARYRRARLERRRVAAQYPITSNDPVNRTVA